MDSLETEQQVRRRTGGRSARVRDEVLAAALDALADLDAADITISELARRSGVHATSIQRRWKTKENVLLDAVLSLSRSRMPIPDTGTLRGDMIALGRNIAAYYRSAAGTTVMRTLAVREDDDAMAENRKQVVAARFALATAIFRRAALRGELRDGMDPQTALELFVGPLHYRELIIRQAVDDAYIAGVVDTLLAGIQAPRAN